MPGVTVTAEVTALKTVRFHNWSMSTDWTFAELGPDGTEFRPYPKSENPRAFIVWCREKTKRFLLARKDDGRTFWYDPSFRVVDGHCVLSGYGRKIASGGLVLEAGQSVTMTRTAGRVLSPGDEEKIALLQGRTVCDGREGGRTRGCLREGGVAEERVRAAPPGARGSLRQALPPRGAGVSR